MNDKKIKEAVYSPYTQAMRHREILKKRWIKKNSKLIVAMREKSFDTLWYKPLVVLSNSKSILNTKYAPKDVKSSTIRVDQLVEYIKKDLATYDRSLLSNQQSMLELANTFLEGNVERHTSFANKYKNIVTNDDDLIEILKKFRRKRSKEKGIPAYFVFSDKELNDIVDKKPTKIEDLNNILPDIRIRSHGKEILEVINKKGKE